MATADPKPDPRLPLVAFQFNGKPTKHEPKQCQLCWTKFSLIKSRHHCANCFNCICSNCSQGRGRRETPDSWMDEVIVKLCDYCMPNLMIQALTRTQLRKLPKNLLQDYVKAYNLTESNEKDTIIDSIVSAHPMPLLNELHYRKMKPAHKNTGDSWKIERKNRAKEAQTRPALSIDLPTPPADNLSQSLPSSISIRSDTSQLSNDTNRISNAFDSLPQEWAEIIDPTPSPANVSNAPRSNLASNAPIIIPASNAPISSPANAPISSLTSNAPIISPASNAPITSPASNAPITSPASNAPIMSPTLNASISSPMSNPSISSFTSNGPISPSSAPLAIPRTNRTPSPSPNFLRHPTLSPNSASARSSTPSPSSSPLSPYLQSQSSPDYYQQNRPVAQPWVPQPQQQQYPPAGYAMQSPLFSPQEPTRLFRNLPAIPGAPIINSSTPPLMPPLISPPLPARPPRFSLYAQPPQTPPRPFAPPLAPFMPTIPPRPVLSTFAITPSHPPFFTPTEPLPRNFAIPTITSLLKSRVSLSTLSEETLEGIIAAQGVEIPPGLLEKSDLVREVQGMVDARRRDQEQDEDRDICKVCLDNEIQTVLVECGHMAVCIECGDKLMAKVRPECPICRARIIKVLRTFRS